MTSSEIEIPQPSLRTSRLLLRSFVENDIQRLVVIANEEDIAANTCSIPHPYTQEHAVDWVASHRPNWNTSRGVAFAICAANQVEQDHAELHLIGSIGFKIDVQNEKAELGYWVGKDYRNQGFCSEAAIAMLDFGFAGLGLNKITAQHLTRNPASGRVLEKIGMQQEGLARAHFKKLEIIEDVTFYGLVREDWNNR